MEKAAPRTVLGDFGDVVFTYFGRESRFWRDGSSFRVTTENLQGQPQTFEVAYTLGFAPLQQYLVDLGDGRIQALPFAWDARPRAEGGQRWFHLYGESDVTPGNPLFWLRPRQNWNHMCADCHTTGFQKRFSDATGRFDSQWSELGDGCESCHGAGARHVEAAGRSASRATSGRFVNGLHTQAEQLDQCGVCHARRVRLREEPSHERLHDTWRLELLREGLYFPDGQIQDEVFEVGSFLQSKMAARGVACSHCHDPHSAHLRAEGNALCTQCHDRKLFDGPQHHFHAVGTDGARCVNCHMPTRTYMVVHARRDHRIAVPRPDLSATLGTPNACATCHEARGNAWAAEAIAAHRSGRRQGPSGAELLGPVLWSARHQRPDAAAAVQSLLASPEVSGLAKATALSRLGTSAPSEARRLAEPLLHAEDPWLRLGAAEALVATPEPSRHAAWAVLAHDPARDVRFAVAPSLGEAQGKAGAFEDEPAIAGLLAAYESWLTANADRAEALGELARLRRAAGDPSQARALFARALARDETSLSVHLNFADALRASGDEAGAEALLRKACSLFPDSAQAHFALGMSLVRQRQAVAGVQELGRARELAPSNGDFAYAYAVGLHSTRQDELAVTILRDAHERFPSHAGIEAALGSLCGQSKGTERLARCP